MLQQRFALTRNMVDITKHRQIIVDAHVHVFKTTNLYGKKIQILS